MSRWAATVAVAPVFGIIVLACLPSARAAAEPTGNVVYQPPVDAPVTDVFRPPAQRWSAGNRGVDYGTTEGQVVRAAAPGQVVFAGQVGGSLHVVVLHADGAIDFVYGDMDMPAAVVGIAAGDGGEPIVATDLDAARGDVSGATIYETFLGEGP